MLSLNKEGYTKEEVMDVLHGKHGARLFDFRFDLLNENEQVIGDITPLVEAGQSQVDMDSEAEIHRTAKFRVRDTGQIDFLKHRIQPFARVKMPRKTERIQKTYGKTETTESDLSTGTLDNVVATSEGGVELPSVEIDNPNLYFDGNSSVTIPNTNNRMQPAQQTTWELWFKIDLANHTQYDSLMGFSTNSWDIRMDAENNFTCHTYDTSGSWIPISVQPGYSMWDEEWHHLAIVWDGVNGERYAYVDGVQTGYYTMSAGVMPRDMSAYGYTTFSIGAVSNGGSRTMSGYIDDVRIWDTARTAQEISDNMNSELTGDEPGLKAYYKFNEAAGVTAADSSPNGYDGNINGAVYDSSTILPPIKTYGKQEMQIDDTDFENGMNDWMEYVFSSPSYTVERVSDTAKNSTVLHAFGDGSGGKWGVEKDITLPNDGSDVFMEFDYRVMSALEHSGVTNLNFEIRAFGDGGRYSSFYAEDVNPNAVSDTGWQAYFKDISSIVDGYDGVRIRFYQQDNWSADHQQEFYLDNIKINSEKITSIATGDRQSPPFDVSNTANISNTEIAWSATEPSGTSVTIETSLDGSTWTQATNGGAIPNVGDELTTNYLYVRQTLNTSDSSVTPQLHDLTITIDGWSKKVIQSQYIEFPLGVFLLSTPQREYENNQQYRNIDAYDKLQILVDDGFTARYVAHEGDNIIDEVKQIIQEAGITKVNIESHDKILPTWLAWDPDVSRLEVVNELLGIINYEPVYVDEYGYFTSRPYRTPAQRAAEYEYKTDELSVIEPGATLNEDYFNVPNEWVGVVSEPDRVPLTYTYQNNNEDSPTSIPSRGRTITKYVDVDAADLESLQGIVEKQAYKDSQVYTEMEFNTAIMPMHSYNDVYHIDHVKLGANAKFEEISWSLPLDPQGSMSHRAKRVISLTGGA